MIVGVKTLIMLIGEMSRDSHQFHRSLCIYFFKEMLAYLMYTNVFLIRCHIHLVFHQMLISIPGMKRSGKGLLSGCGVEWKKFGWFSMERIKNAKKLSSKEVNV